MLGRSRALQARLSNLEMENDNENDDTLLLCSFGFARASLIWNRKGVSITTRRNVEPA